MSYIAEAECPREDYNCTHCTKLAQDAVSEVLISRIGSSAFREAAGDVAGLVLNYDCPSKYVDETEFPGVTCSTRQEFAVQVGRETARHQLAELETFPDSVPR